MNFYFIKPQQICFKLIKVEKKLCTASFGHLNAKCHQMLSCLEFATCRHLLEATKLFNKTAFSTALTFKSSKQQRTIRVVNKFKWDRAY